MGRALFSKTHAPAPAVRTESERIADTCQKWSAWNKFDPDSEEFFSNAQLELFIDADAVLRGEDEMREGIRRRVLESALDSGSDTSDSGSSDGEGPIAPQTGLPTLPDSVDPVLRAILAEHNRRLAVAAVPHGPNDGRMSSRDAQVVASRSYRHPNRAAVVQSAVISPSVVRGPPASTVPSTAQVPLLSRFAVPVRVGSESWVRPRTPPPARSRSPSPMRAYVVPSTPPALSSTQALVTPSPPGSVTPHTFYSWQTHAIPAVPTSPTVIRGNRDGPLTNPRARMSFAQLSNAQSPVLVQNVN